MDSKILSSILPPLREGRNFEGETRKMRGGVEILILQTINQKPHPKFFGQSPQNLGPPTRGGQIYRRKELERIKHPIPQHISH